MELVRKALEKGEPLYVAIAHWSSYSGSMVWGDTTHYLMSYDSNPKFSLTISENRQLGLVKDAPDIIYSRSITKERHSTPKIIRGYTIYVAKKPFKVWIAHRGYTGDRNDSYDKIVESIEIRTLEEFLKYL